MRPDQGESRDAGRRVAEAVRARWYPDRCPSWRWMMFTATPSRARSTAFAWRSWWGANRRRTPASVASWRSSARAAAAAHRRPQVDPSITQNNGPGGSDTRTASQAANCSNPNWSMPASRRSSPMHSRDASRRDEETSRADHNVWTVETSGRSKAPGAPKADACLREGERPAEPTPALLFVAERTVPSRRATHVAGHTGRAHARPCRCVCDAPAGKRQARRGPRLLLAMAETLCRTPFVRRRARASRWLPSPFRRRHASRRRSSQART